MRASAALVLMLGLSACSGDPASYGITGPGMQPVPGPSGTTVDAPAIPNTGSTYGPSVVPSTGNGNYWNYN